LDTQTRHALKQDKLITATQSGFDWLQEHRERAIKISIAAMLVVVVLVVGVVMYFDRSEAAETALGQALDTYSAPLTQPGQPATPGQITFATAALRSKAANQQFTDIANRYGWLRAGKNAKYFAGVTAMELGQNGIAENDLQDIAGSYDSNLAALAKVALAGLYEQTGRSAKAIVLYQELIAKPTVTVPQSAAKLLLANLYQSTNPAQAQRIYAELKGDKGAAGEIAAEKLAQHQ
jgi:hypothetical protein